MRKFKKGFTIIELVIVIAVIAILAAVLIPTFSGVVRRAKESAALQESTAAFYEKMIDPLLEGKDTIGMTFVNDGYVVVNFERNLQKIGEKGVSEDTMFKAYNISDTANIDAFAQIVNDGTEDVTINKKADETLYFYTVEVDGKTYLGCFIYVEDDAHKYGDTYYSSEFGAIEQTTEGTKLKVKVVAA